MPQNLNKETVERTFKLLAAVLDLKQSEPFRLVICGGTALIATGLRSRTTNDADVVALLNAAGELINPQPLPPALLAAAAQVADDLGLSAN